MSKLYFVLEYVDKPNERHEARYLELSSNSNLICIFEDFRSIKDYNIGNIALLNIVANFKTKKEALATCEAWNNTYKQENKFFGGN